MIRRLFVPLLVLAWVPAACGGNIQSAPPKPRPEERPLAVPSASSADPTPPPPTIFEAQKITDEGRAMGTHIAFTAFTEKDVDGVAVHRAFTAALDEIRRVETMMTTWRPDAELSRVNTAAGKSAVEVSAETLHVVQSALEASVISSGAFDITFESMHGVWKFDEDWDPHPPSAAQVRKLLPLVDYRRVRVDAAKSTIFLEKPGVRISLGGIAKGYAVDCAARTLTDAGLRSFYVQAGGDLYTKGLKPDGSPWLAGISDPRSETRDAFALLQVSDHAFSTAGDYERAYVVGGKRYHHIIDPRTGYPATASRSVTIWAKTALQADAIDDAVFILGPEKGLALVETLDDVGAVIVDAKNKVWISKRLEGKVKILHPPSEGL